MFNLTSLAAKSLFEIFTCITKFVKRNCKYFIALATLRMFSLKNYQLRSERWNDLLPLDHVEVDRLEEGLLDDVAGGAALHTEPVVRILVQQLKVSKQVSMESLFASSVLINYKAFFHCTLSINLGNSKKRKYFG